VTAHPQATAALAQAQRMMSQTSPAIWFDSWYNDLRDNNLDGAIDDAGERSPDGSHHAGTYTAKVAPMGRLTVGDVPDSLLRTIPVTYRVCIDIPIESYATIGVPIARSRWIPTFFATLQALPGWQVWLHGNHPPALLDGDIVAANNPVHQHAGIVETGVVYDSVINLPGPTSARRYGMYSPSGYNDMAKVPRFLFEQVLGIECYARWTGK
jgi:hypothetical protein